MSLLDEWLLEPTDIPFEKRAAFLVELQRPTIPAPLPSRTAAVQAGQLKIAALTFSQGVEALPEIERQALVDPNVAAALEYEQTKAENAELQQQLEASQAQLAMVTQQQQMAQQQLMEAQQAQEQMQAQVEEASQGQQMAQQQAVDAQQASLAERVQSMEQREQLAQAATDMKTQLEQLAEGLGQLRGQAAGPPPEAQGEPIPQPDPTAPADVRKEQEQAQKAELEAEQQKAQAGLAEEQKAVEQEVNAPPPAGAAAAPPPAPGMEEMGAPAGPGGPVAGAPQVPTPAGGALPKTSSAKQGPIAALTSHALSPLSQYSLAKTDIIRGKPLGTTAQEYRKKHPEFAESIGLGRLKEKGASGSTHVQLPMAQYPQAPKTSVLAGAATMKLPAVGRVIPQLKRLTEDSSKLQGIVDPEQLKEDPQPEVEKKVDPALQEKQASMWKQASAANWLFKLGQEETVADSSVAELAEQLKDLDAGQLEQLLSSLSEEPEYEDEDEDEDSDVTIARRRTMDIPSEGPARGEEEYRVGVGGEEVAQRLRELDLNKEGMGQLGASVAEGAIRGGVIGAGVGGISRGVQAYGQGADLPPGEREGRAIREAAKGAVMGAAIGAVTGGIGGATTLRAQDVAAANVPRFHPQTGAAIPEAARAGMMGEAARGVVMSRAHPAGIISGLIGGSKGPEAVERVMGKTSSAALHPRLAKFAQTLDEYTKQQKQQLTSNLMQRQRQQGQSTGSILGAAGGAFGGNALGGLLSRGGSGRTQLIARGLGVGLGLAGGGAAGWAGGGALGERAGKAKAERLTPYMTPEHMKPELEAQQALKGFAAGNVDRQGLSDALMRRRVARGLLRQKLLDAKRRGEL